MPNSRILRLGTNLNIFADTENSGNICPAVCDAVEKFLLGNETNHTQTHSLSFIKQKLKLSDKETHKIS